MADFVGVIRAGSESQILLQIIQRGAEALELSGTSKPALAHLESASARPQRDEPLHDRQARARARALSR